ncbi:hypothetical protein GIX45_02405 [Erwinia sp. CPCC 100877]|nr:hypothetical protein [Erwinia sp. CPCC 100877]
MYGLILALAIVLFIHSLLLAFIVRKNSRLTSKVGQLRKEMNDLAKHKRITVSTEGNPNKKERSVNKRKNRAVRESKGA